MIMSNIIKHYMGMMAFLWSVWLGVHTNKCSVNMLPINSNNKTTIFYEVTQLKYVKILRMV